MTRKRKTRKFQYLPLHGFRKPRAVRQAPVAGPREKRDFLERTASYGKESPREAQKMTGPLSVLIHATALAGLLVVPLLVGSRPPSPATTLIATLATLAPPPPPPPAPPKAPPAPARPTRRLTTGLIEPARFVAPVAIPDAISEEQPGDGWGVEGGVPGGIPGGIVGGLPESPRMAAATETEPLRVAEGRSEAIPIVRVNPVYPDAAVRARVQGKVLIDALIDVEGRPVELRVLRGVPLLENAALEAVRKWRWRPYLWAGQAVPFWVSITVDFKLNLGRPQT